MFLKILVTKAAEVFHVAIVLVAFNLLFFLWNCFIQAPCLVSNLNAIPGKPCNQKANASADIVMQKVWP